MDAAQERRLRQVAGGEKVLGHTPTPIEQTLAAVLLSLVGQHEERRRD